MNLNKAIILGNLTQDPEAKTIASGNNVTTFTIATNRVWKDQQGQKQQQAEFHNIVCWGKLAEIAGQYLTKGQLCMVEGRLQTRNWDDQNGVRHWKTEIVADNFQMGPRTGQDTKSYDGQNTNSNNNQSNNSAPANSGAPADKNEDEIKVEDIPF